MSTATATRNRYDLRPFTFLVIFRGAHWELEEVAIEAYDYDSARARFFQLYGSTGAHFVSASRSRCQVD